MEKKKKPWEHAKDLSMNLLGLGIVCNVSEKLYVTIESGLFCTEFRFKSKDHRDMMYTLFSDLETNERLGIVYDRLANFDVDSFNIEKYVLNIYSVRPIPEEELDSIVQDEKLMLEYTIKTKEQTVSVYCLNFIQLAHSVLRHYKIEEGSDDSQGLETIGSLL